MIEQRSKYWDAARRGRVTASRISDVMTKTRTGYGASRANYMAQLIAERLTGVTAESFTNAAMQWGIEQEPNARDAYAFLQDAEVQEVGFIDHPHIEMSGASPDGFVSTDGLVEIKCPNTSTHLDFLLSGKIDDKYIKQMQWQMACTERTWCDFVSYDPRLPVDLSIKVVRVKRDYSLIAEIEDEVMTFLAELDKKLAQIESLRIKNKENAA